MNAFSELVQSEMDKRKWLGADLARKSGISKSQISNILQSDDLDRMPERTTITKLADALRIPREKLLLAAAQAHGVPVQAPVTVATTDGVSDDDLLRALADRLARAATTVALPMLDIASLGPGAVTDIIDLMTSLRKSAEESDAADRSGLGVAQRFLADQLQSALDASISTGSPAPSRHA